MTQTFVSTARAAGDATDGTHVTDDALIQAYRSGDAPAFDRLYARYKGPVYRFLARQLPEAEAQDAFQETWMKLLDALDRYRPQGTFQAYLFTLAHNVLMDAHRRRMRAPVPDGTHEPPDDAPRVDEQAARAELHAHLYTEIARLPVAQRTAWLMRQETDLSLAEIAQVTGTSPEGIKSRLRYATEKLKAGMQKYVRTR